MVMRLILSSVYKCCINASDPNRWWLYLEANIQENFGFGPLIAIHGQQEILI